MAIVITYIDLGFFRLFIIFFFCISSLGLFFNIYYVCTGSIFKYTIFKYTKLSAQNGIYCVSCKKMVYVYLRPEQFYRRYIAFVSIFKNFPFDSPNENTDFELSNYKANVHCVTILSNVSAIADSTVWIKN